MINKQALLKQMVSVADTLDDMELLKEAEEIDVMMKKVADVGLWDELKSGLSALKTQPMSYRTLTYEDCPEGEKTYYPSKDCEPQWKTKHQWPVRFDARVTVLMQGFKDGTGSMMSRGTAVSVLDDIDVQKYNAALSTLASYKSQNELADKIVAGLQKGINPFG